MQWDTEVHKHSLSLLKEDESLADSLCLGRDLTAKGSGGCSYCRRGYLSPGHVSIRNWIKAMDSFVIIPKGAFMSNEFWALEAKVAVIKMYP